MDVDFMLIRRSLTDPTEKSYFFVFAPSDTSLSEMVKAIGARWHIEENFENAKDLGLDHYEVRNFIGWYRHITLVLVAAAYPDREDALPTAAVLKQLSPCITPSRVCADSSMPVRHLLARLIWPNSRSARRILAWSWWHSFHRGIASYYHTKRRLKAS